MRMGLLLDSKEIEHIYPATVNKVGWHTNRCDHMYGSAVFETHAKPPTDPDWIDACSRPILFLRLLRLMTTHQAGVLAHDLIIRLHIKGP